MDQMIWFTSQSILSKLSLKKYLYRYWWLKFLPEEAKSVTNIDVGFVDQGLSYKMSNIWSCIFYLCRNSSRFEQIK